MAKEHQYQYGLTQFYLLKNSRIIMFIYIILFFFLLVTLPHSVYASGKVSKAISEQTTVISDKIKADCAICQKEGLGKYIQNVVDMQVAANSVVTDTSELFSLDNSCFSYLKDFNLTDLSKQIPSIGTILGELAQKAIDAILNKACEAVLDVSGMVVGPVNQVIDQINNMANMDFSGMMMDKVKSGALNSINSGLSAPVTRSSTSVTPLSTPVKAKRARSPNSTPSTSQANTPTSSVEVTNNTSTNSANNSNSNPSSQKKGNTESKSWTSKAGTIFD